MSELQGEQRKLKVPNPSASTGKGGQEKKQACAGFLTVGCHLIRGARGYGRRVGNSGCKAVLGVG